MCTIPAYVAATYAAGAAGTYVAAKEATKALTPKVPAPPTPPTKTPSAADAIQAASPEARKPFSTARRRARGKSAGGTILTGSGGLLAQATTAQKTLLGQ